MNSRRLRLLALVPAAALLLGACSSGVDDDAGGPEVVVTAYPMQFIAERVAGDAATVTSVAPAGTEPHDLELSPAGVATLDAADVALVLSGFQAAVDDAVTNLGDDGPVVVDAADSADLLTSEEEHGHEDEEHADDEHADEEHAEDEHAHDHGGVDPHFWLDPARVAAVGEALAASLAGADPENAAVYEDNAAALTTELTTLRDDIETGLAGCADRSFVVSHEAFGYLADAFDLDQIGISGIDPEAEPSPARVAEVLTEARDAGVTTVFTQPGGLTAGADDVAAELGVELATLDPLELEPDGTDYVGAMRENLASLADGLSCG